MPFASLTCIVASFDILRFPDPHKLARPASLSAPWRRQVSLFSVAATRARRRLRRGGAGVGFAGSGRSLRSSWTTPVTNLRTPSWSNATIV